MWPGLKGWGPTWAWSCGRSAGAPTTPLPVERLSQDQWRGSEGVWLWGKWVQLSGAPGLEPGQGPEAPEVVVNRTQCSRHWPGRRNQGCVTRAL